MSGLLLLSLSVSAFAEEPSGYKAGEYYFAPGVAYYHFSDKRDLQNAALVNLSAGLVVSEKFSLEAFYGQASTESSSSDDDGSRFYAYWMDGVYHFQSEKQTNFHPYIFTGLGLTNQNTDSDASGNTTLLGVNAGAGLEYFVNPNISLFTDVRDIYTLSGGKNDWMLNAGIKFFFGGSAPVEKESTPPIETTGATGFYQLQESSPNEV